MTHTHTALLEIGQHTSRPVLEDYILEDQDGQDINLANAQEVTMTTQHHATGLVETAAQPVEITDANNGEIRYQFDPEEIPLDGRYDVQFFIEYENGDTQAVPPGTGWFPFISVARKLPGEKMSARFSGLRVDELTVGSFNADEIVSGAISGAIVGGQTITRLDGPNISINDHGELAVGTTDGSTDLVDHDHSATGEGGDTLRPYQVGSSSSRVDQGHFNTLTATGMSVQGNDVWHAGNDGDESGLDADLLDGTQASEFASSGHSHSLGDLSNVSATGEGSENGLNADQVDGHEASELKGTPDLIVVNDYSGADPSGRSASDSAFSAAISDANPGDTVLFYNGTFLLENNHDISKPLTIKCGGADLELTVTHSSGNERAQLRFMGGGVEAQTGITSAKPEGSRVIPVSDTSIFSTGDYVLLMNDEYSLGVDTESQFATVESADTTNGNIVIDAATDHDFSGTAHRVSLIESPRFVNISTFGGGDMPLLFRWCEDARYDRCEVTEYLQTPLAAIDCYKPKWYDVEAYKPLSRGSGEGEAVCLYRTTDAYVESPRIYDCRRGMDIAWGCTNTQIIDPVVKGFSIAGISVHQSNVGGDVRIVGGKLVADPDGLTGNGITGSPNGTTLSVQGTDIITRRSGIHASGVTKISDVTISPAETVNSGVGLQIAGGPVQADGIIIDDPDGQLNQPIDVTSSSRPIRGVDIDARINYNAENAVYFETDGYPIEDVDLSGTIQSDSTAPGQCVFFYSTDGAFDNVDYSMDILNHAEYGIRLDGDSKNGEFRFHDAIFDCDPGGVPILDYSGWGGAEQVWIKNCTLLYDSSGHSDSVHLGSGTVDYGWVVDNYAPGAVNISAVTNSETRGNMG